MGIIGCGRVTTMFHIKAIKEVKELEVIAVADKDVHRARKVGEKIGARWYRDHRDLLSNGDVEAVAINTPPSLHEEMSLDALTSYKHVLCEKPVARNVEGCRRIVSEAERRGLIVQPFHNYAHTPIIDDASHLIEEGELGEIIEVSVRFMNNLRGYRPRTSFRFEGDHSIIEDLLPHILSVTGLFTGWRFEVLKVEGWRERYPVVDNFTFRLRVKDISLVGRASWTSLIPRFVILIVGSNGSLKMELMRKPWSLEFIKYGKAMRIGNDGLRVYLRLLRMSHPSFKRQYRHFYRVVRGMEKPRLSMGEEEAIVATLSEAREVLRIHE